MKNTERIYKSFFLLILTLLATSCSDEFLEEVPQDFLVSENAFTDPEGFKAGIASLHRSARDIWTHADGTNAAVLMGLGSDLAYYEYGNGSVQRMNYEGISSDDGLAANYWNMMYALIKDANVIITRAEDASINWEYDNQKTEIIAEATFFRAYAYRILAQLFGGVPILDFENTGVLNDVQRASKSETYQFIIDDLRYCTQNLPYEEKEPGRISRAAALHLLAEAYVATEQWQAAIDASSTVINDPNYELMTERFGSRSGEPGDVYWDLFRIGNQNRVTGNKETIWAVQLEWETQGGGYSTGAKGLPMERAWTPYRSSLKDPDNKKGFEVNDEYGRGAGFCTPTDYLAYTIWDINHDDSYDDDMRNSLYNIHRVERGQFIYDNSSSAYFGTPMTLETAMPQSLAAWFPIFIKNTTPNNHPGGVINQGRIWRDHYVMRLAETYLLRAEAYLGAGELGLAAADINKVRERANAEPITSSDVDIDFILDERARELSMEELRTLTLQRLGLQYERTRDLNFKAGPTIAPHNNLWPIPQTDIDLNTGAVLEQNPGY